MLGLQTLIASSVGNDGFEELKKGNVLEAANIFQNACNAGASSGCYNLGLMYYKGKEIAQNYPKAAEHFTKACDDGHNTACYTLAYM